MQFSRRDFVKTGFFGAMAMTVTGCKGFPCCRKKPQIGVQLYSVRNLCAKDLFGTLKGIKEIGYHGVEFAGYYGKDAATWKKMLDDVGLVACGTHTGLGSILPGSINKTIDFAAEVGNRYLMVPGMGPGKGYKGSVGDWWKKTAEDFNQAAETAKKAGMVVGYHNHQHEFRDKCADHGNKSKWEIFWSNTTPEVSMQMDIGHVVSAGEDPIYWLNRFPNPCRTVHAKETYPGPGILGQPKAGAKGVDWDKVFPVVEQKQLDWYVVESEADPSTLERIKGCFEFLKSKGRA